MPTQDRNVPLNVLADERAHPAFFRLARACITLARLSRDDRRPPEQEAKDPSTGAAQ